MEDEIAKLIDSQMKSDYLRNPLIKSFLRQDKNLELFKVANENPTGENIKKLDAAFKIFYSEIRFINYISKTIHFFSVDFDKFKRRYNKLYCLILDQPFEKQNSKTVIKDMISSVNTIEEELSIYDFIHFINWIENDKLYNAIKKLTNRQLEVLQLYFLEEKKDTEIAKLLGVTQQAISKICRVALLKLHRNMTGGGENGFIHQKTWVNGSK